MTEETSDDGNGSFSAEDAKVLDTQLSALDDSRINRSTSGITASERRDKLLQTIDKIRDMLRTASNCWGYLDENAQATLIKQGKKTLAIMEIISSLDDGSYDNESSGMGTTADTLYGPLIPLRSQIAVAERLKEKEAKTDDVLDSIISIEEGAKETAGGVSVVVAQKEFGEAASYHETQATIWAIASVVVFVIFFIVIASFFSKAPLVKDELSLLYGIGLRIILLGSIASIAAIFVNLTKAHLHLREHNLHRKRIANSVGAFLGATSTLEMKDQILSQLVDAVTSFGNSGIVASKNLGSEKESGLRRLIQHFPRNNME